MDAHAKEGSDVDIVAHKVFRCITWDGSVDKKKYVGEHILTLSLMYYLDMILHQQNFVEKVKQS